MSFTTTIKISVNKNHTLRAYEYTFLRRCLLQLQEPGPDVNTPQVLSPLEAEKGEVSGKIPSHSFLRKMERI